MMTAGGVIVLFFDEKQGKDDVAQAAGNRYAEYDYQEHQAQGCAGIPARDAEADQIKKRRRGADKRRRAAQRYLRRV